MNRAVILLCVLACTQLAHAQSSFNSPDTGTKVLGSYFATNMDSVNMKNGNLHVSIPLFSLPGRELPLSLGVTYDSRFIEARNFVNDVGVGGYHYESFAWRKATSLGGILTASYTVPGTSCGANCQNVNIAIQWVKNDNTKYSWTKTVQQSTYPSFNPPFYAIFDNHTIDSTDSEFLRIETGTYFNSYGATSPAVVTAKDGTKMIFSPSNGFEIRTPNGNRLQQTGLTTSSFSHYASPNGDVHYNYDILPTSDTVARTITYSGSPTAEVITLTDANGQAKQYTINWGVISGNFHDFHGSLPATYRVVQSIVLPNSKSFQFQYDSNGNLSKIIFPTGAYIRYTYASWADGYVGGYSLYQKIVSADGTVGSEKTWTYNFNWTTNGVDFNAYTLSTSTVTDPAGGVEQHSFSDAYCGDGCYGTGTDYRTTYIDGGANLKQIDKTWSTGSNPNLQAVTTTMGTQVSKKTYTYDTYNNVTEQDDYDWGLSAAGPRLRYVVRTYLATTPYTTAHILDRLLTEKTYTDSGTLIAETDYEYDNYAAPNTLVTRGGTVPDWIDPGTTTRGNVTAIKKWLNTTSSWLNTVNQYDNLGNTVTSTDPAGHATSIDFTDRFSDSVSRNSFAYPTQTTPPSGFLTQTTYDFNTGLVTQKTDALNRTTTMTYDVMDRETAENYPSGGWTNYTFDDVTPKVTKQVRVDTANNVGQVITVYDGLYRMIETQTSDPEGTILVDTQYDGKGRKWKVSNPYRSGDQVQWTQFSYDAMDRPKITTAPDTSTVQYAYISNQTVVTDEAGNQRRYTYDALGRMTMVEEPNPTLATPAVTTYTYNVLGKMTGSNQSNQTRTWAFDSLSRITSQTLPESGTTSFTYNADSQLLTKTDARGTVETITYGTSDGSIHQVSAQTYSDSTPPVTFSYNLQGLRIGMIDGLGSVTYAQDPNTDKLTQESRLINGLAGTFSTGYAYNIKGDLTQMMYPSGRVVNLTYNTGGGCCNSRLSVVTDQTTGTIIANGMSYNAAGGLQTQVLNPGTNSVTETMAYNTRLQLTQIRDTKGGVDLMNMTYGYGTSTTNTGRVLTRTDAVQPEHSTMYQYDSIYRLQQTISQDSSWGIAWTFDVWGNRLTQTPQGIVYTTNKVGTQTRGYTNNRDNGMSYDPAGNQTNDGIHNYTFNAENQITQMDGGAAQYFYDGDGKRMKKVTATETTYTFYALGGSISEFTTSNAIATATAASATDKCFYHATDKLGSAVLVINSAGVAVENNRTLPYGEPWMTDTASTNDKKFTTYERDKESNLDYAMNRYMSYNYGRFLSLDKASAENKSPISLNRYLYTADDPVNRTDPTGNYSDQPAVPDPPFCGVEFESCEEGGQPEGGGSMAVAARRAREEAANRWDSLSEKCQQGLTDAMSGQGAMANANRVAALERAEASMGIIMNATLGTSVDPSMVAAIGIRESGFKYIQQGPGDNKGGVGIFQIDLIQNPSVSFQTAWNISSAASWVVSTLNANAATLAAKFPNFNADQLLQATAASYNFGVKNISGNPNTIDVGTTHNNYGSNIVKLMDCFN